MIIALKDGEVTIALRPDLAPNHVARIKALVREGAYDNVAFHRVMKGFMAQTGDVQFGDMEDGFDPDRVGTGGSDEPDLKAEFSAEPYVRGTVGIARVRPQRGLRQLAVLHHADPNSNLNGQYTVVGNVESGMELVDNIKKSDNPDTGVVADPDRMIKVRIAADGK